MTFETRRLLLAGGAALALALSVPFAAAPADAQGKVFRWANDGDANSLDPYALNESFRLGFLLNIYEPLIRRDKNLKLEPGLAVKWGLVNPTTWFFDLRQGVKFHDGSPFTADDVIFSLDRAKGEGSNMKNYFITVKGYKKINDHRVEVETNIPDPLLPDKWAVIMMMSKAWAVKNKSETVGDLTKKQENYATRHTNGTGPFMLKSREPDVKTVLTVNPNWWDKKEGNVTEVVFTRIPNAATRVAALLSGEIDMIYTVPTQDTDKISKDPNTKIIEKPETRVVYLGLDVARNELQFSNVKGKNPFQDKRVREAIYRSIDIDAIKKTVMRNQSAPTALMVGTVINGYDKALDKRPALLKPEQAKKLLADAGYPNGFEVTLDCPNDRYVNDEKICQSVVGMLARIGIKVNLHAQTKGKFFEQILAPRFETSFFMLGWTPVTYDVHDALINLMQTRNAQTKKGQFNVAGYSNPKLDELSDKIQVEVDKAKRNAMIADVTKIYTSDMVYIPLHQQTVIWATRKSVDLVLAADNIFQWRWVKIK